MIGQNVICQYSVFFFGAQKQYFYICKEPKPSMGKRGKTKPEGRKKHEEEQLLANEKKNIGNLISRRFAPQTPSSEIVQFLTKKMSKKPQADTQLPSQELKTKKKDYEIQQELSRVTLRIIGPVTFQKYKNTCTIKKLVQIVFQRDLNGALETNIFQCKYLKGVVEIVQGQRKTLFIKYISEWIIKQGDNNAEWRRLEQESVILAFQVRYKARIALSFLELIEQIILAPTAQQNRTELKRQMLKKSQGLYQLYQDKFEWDNQNKITYSEFENLLENKNQDLIAHLQQQTRVDKIMTMLESILGQKQKQKSSSQKLTQSSVDEDDQQRNSNWMQSSIKHDLQSKQNVSIEGFRFATARPENKFEQNQSLELQGRNGRVLSGMNHVVTNEQKMIEELQNNLFENIKPVILNLDFQNEPQDNFDVKDGEINMQ